MGPRAPGLLNDITTLTEAPPCCESLYWAPVFPHHPLSTRQWSSLPEGTQVEGKGRGIGAHVLALASRDYCVPQGGIFRRESRHA